HVPALNIAGFRQALAKRGQKLCILTRRPGVEKPNHRHRRLLRARRERPRRGAAKKRDEVAALHLRGHLITSSARASSDGGTVRPSALAVLRFLRDRRAVHEKSAGCAVEEEKAFIFRAHSCSFLRLRNETARPRTTFHSSWLVERLHGRVGRRSPKARRSIGQKRRAGVHRPSRAPTAGPGP